MIIHNCVQQSDEWRLVRLGKITASEFSEVLSKGAGRNSYMLKLAAERLTGEVQAGFCNAAMQRGIELEPVAREYYELLNDVKVEQVGFVSFDDWVGCSPDGLIGEDGLTQIKSPNTTTHINYILKDRLPSEYKPQVQGELYVTGRKWCDFISFDDRMKTKKFFCKRVYRDEEYINVLAEAINQFKTELQELIEKITKEPF